jgi:hypothetical protein
MKRIIISSEKMKLLIIASEKMKRLIMGSEQNEAPCYFCSKKSAVFFSEENHANVISAMKK